MVCRWEFLIRHNFVNDTGRVINRDETELVGQEEEEGWFQWTSDVFEVAPDWLERLEVESVWSPVLVMNEKKRDTSVCVYFEESFIIR